MFSAALASGQLGPLMCQFGLPAEAVEAANKGGKCPRAPRRAAPGPHLGRAPHGSQCVVDVEAFAKAMQSGAGPAQEGDGKEKKDEEEDMSLD